MTVADTILQQMGATVLTDIPPAAPGLYVVHSSSPAYFPTLAMVARGDAVAIGQNWDDEGSWVTVQVGGKRALAAPPEVGKIGIGRDFFLGAVRDYAEWKTKWWREVIQNAIDADASNVELRVEKTDEGYVVSCEDDGRGMDEDTLLNKFLMLGGTTKEGSSTTAGGFGKAKELILLPWLSWHVSSRNLTVDGAGVDYKTTVISRRQGTLVKALMTNDFHTETWSALDVLQKSYLPDVRFFLTGPNFSRQRVRAALKGEQLYGTVPGKAEIYFTPNRVEENYYIFIRARGLFMFTRWVGKIPGKVIVEITAPSIEILSANRDGFRDPEVTDAVDRLAQKIAKDVMSTFRESQGLIRRKFRGRGIFLAKRRAGDLLERVGPRVDWSSGRSTKVSKEDRDALAQEIENMRTRAEASRTTDNVAELPPPPAVDAMMEHKFDGPRHVEAAVKRLAWEPDFIIINEIPNYKVPSQFFPGTMTPKILKLAKTWVELCRFTLIQLADEHEFGVGFIFSKDAAAAALPDTDEAGEVENWIMLNPFRTLSYKPHGPTWSPSKDADLKWIYAAAIHEVTHVANGIKMHDEAFAAALTHNMAKCADGYRKIRRITQAITMKGSAQADVRDRGGFYEEVDED